MSVILLSPFYRYNSLRWQERYKVFTEMSWQGIESVAQISGLFQILLDYLTTHMGSVIWESPLVSKQGEQTQKKSCKLEQYRTMLQVCCMVMDETGATLRWRKSCNYSFSPSCSCILPPLVLSCFAANLLSVPARLCWPFSCLSMYYSL